MSNGVATEEIIKRRLNREEISYIIANIPYPQLANDKVSNETQNNLITDFSISLLSVVLPEPDISTFINTLISNINDYVSKLNPRITVPLSTDVLGSISQNIITNTLNDLSEYTKLTDEQISDILSNIPKIRAATEEISIINRNNIILLFQKNLANFRLRKVIIPEFINRLKIKIYNAFKKSQANPGTPAGAHAAESIAVPMIQGTLDSFKTTGSSVATYGEKTSEEIVALSSRNPEIIKIFFNHPISDIEILRDKRPDLVEVNVGDLIHPNLKFEIDDPYDILGEEEPYWYAMHRTYLEKKHSNFELGNVMMRLHVNVNLMCEKRISMTKICKTILGYKIGRVMTHNLSKASVESALNSDYLVCIPSPIMTETKVDYLDTHINHEELSSEGTLEGEFENTEDILSSDGKQKSNIKKVIYKRSYAYIDIFPISDKIVNEIIIHKDVVDSELRTQLSKETFLEVILVPAFEEMHVKGIKGINGVFLERAKVTQIVNKQEPEIVTLGDLELSPDQQVDVIRYLFPNNQDVDNLISEAYATNNVELISGNQIRIWKLYYSKRRIKSMGIGTDKLVHLLQVCGIVVLKYTDEELANGDDILYLKVIVPLRTDKYDEVTFGKLDSELATLKEKLEKSTQNERDSNKLRDDIQKLTNKINIEKRKDILPLSWVDYRYNEEEAEDVKFTKLKEEEIVKYTQGLIKDTDQEFEFRKRQPKDRNTSVVLAYDVVYALAQGKNLKEVLKRSDVDVQLTYSNDFYEIYNTFGIEGLRNFIIEELVGYSNVIGVDSVAPRHTVLLADFMTYKGIPTKITFTGLQDEFEETFKSVGFERPYNVMLEASLVGNTETTLSNISSIFLGKEANIGESYKDVYIKKEYAESIEKEFDTIDIDTLMQNISDFTGEGEDGGEEGGNIELQDETGEGIVSPDADLQILAVDPEPELKLDVAAGLMVGEKEQDKLELKPPIISSEITQTITKKALNRIVPIREIFTPDQMTGIVISPLGEEAVISQMPIEVQRQQREIEDTRGNITVPEIELAIEPEPGLFDLLNYASQVSIPIDSGL